MFEYGYMSDAEISGVQVNRNEIVVLNEFKYLLPIGLAALLIPVVSLGLVALSGNVSFINYVHSISVTLWLFSAIAVSGISYKLIKAKETPEVANWAGRLIPMTLFLTPSVAFVSQVSGYLVPSPISLFSPVFLFAQLVAWAAFALVFLMFIPNSMKIYRTLKKSKIKGVNSLLTSNFKSSLV